MQKILFLLLVIQVVIGNKGFAQDFPKNSENNTTQEFDVFPEQIEIVNIELGDSILLKKIQTTFQLATKAMTELQSRQNYNNGIIESGNNKIAELNREAATLHGLVKGYFSDRDTTQRTKLMEFLGVKEYENDTLLAIMVNTTIETMKLEGETINILQDKSIAQNVKDEKFCNGLITQWQIVMREMMIYFSDKNASESDRNMVKTKMKTALQNINKLCKSI